MKYFPFVSILNITLKTNMDWKEKLEEWKTFYNDVDHEIVEPRKDGSFIKRKAYEMSLKVDLSPIEVVLYDLIYTKNLPFYPQYPVLNYVTDFCDPIKKIIIECDGKDYHDLKKDIIRDTFLNKNGYKVFRLSGSKIMRNSDNLEEKMQDILTYEGGEDDEEYQMLLWYYYENTGFGFIESLKDIFYNEYFWDRGITHYEMKLNSLAKNRVIDFKLLTILPDRKCR